MRTIAVYPGRFHVFHKGHKSVYDHLIDKYGPENVYIATSEKQAPMTSPFTYSDKIAMMTKMGVPASKIVKVVNPYKIEEMVNELCLDPGHDRLVYALGGRDADRFKYTKTSPLQLLTDKTKLKPVGKHAYVEVVPVAEFNIDGHKVDSGTEVRELYLDGNEADRRHIIADLYGEVDPDLKDIFDRRLGVVEKVNEYILETKRSKKPEQVKWVKKVLALEHQALHEHQILTENIVTDYIDEKNHSRHKLS